MTIIATSPSELRTWADLAADMCVPFPALDTVPLVPAPCRQSNCLLSAAQTITGGAFFVRSRGFRANLTRMARLSSTAVDTASTGLIFFVTFGERFARAAARCCAPPLCKKLGYSHKGMIQLPLKLEYDAGALCVLGLPEGARQRSLDNPK